MWLWSLSPSVVTKETCVAKMASHAIFQYNVLVIDDTHNTWTNMIVKMNIPRLLGSSDDKEKIGVARPEGPPLQGFRWRNCIRRCIDLEQFWSVLHSPVEPTLQKLYTSVHWQMKTEENTYTGWTDDAPVNLIGSVVQRGDFSWNVKKLHSPVKPTIHRLNRRYTGWFPTASFQVGSLHTPVEQVMATGGASV